MERMDCRIACEMLEHGQETPDLLRHLASCATCRTRPDAAALLHRPLSPVARPNYGWRRRLIRLLPFGVGGLAVIMIIVSLGILIVRARRHSSVRTVEPIARPAIELPALHRLTIEVEPQADIFINGKLAGKSPYAAEVPRGRYDIEARAAGHHPAHRVVTIDNAHAFLQFVLEKIPPNSPRARSTEPAPANRPPEKTPSQSALQAVPRTPVEFGAVPREIPIGLPATPDAEGKGYLSITSAPWARVFIDDRDTGRSTPIVKMSLSAGKHHLELRTPGASLELDVTVARDRETRIHREIK